MNVMPVSEVIAKVAEVFKKTKWRDWICLIMMVHLQRKSFRILFIYIACYLKN